MNIKCLLGHHKWRFSYNYGMPFGIGMEKAMEMFKHGTTYPVHRCERCGKYDSKPDTTAKTLRAEGRQG